MTVATEPRAIDLAIAEHVLHWDITHHGVRDAGMYLGYPPGATGSGVMIPNYTRDIHAAWKIVDALNAEGLLVEITSFRTDLPDITETGAHVRVSRHGDVGQAAWGATPALAICRAALAHRGIPVPA